MNLGKPHNHVQELKFGLELVCSRTQTDIHLQRSGCVQPHARDAPVVCAPHKWAVCLQVLSLAVLTIWA